MPPPCELRTGQGGIWRQPPRGRAPLPRFSVLSAADRDAVADRRYCLAVELERILVPGGHLFIAANPLMSSCIFASIEMSGFEKRGEIVRTIRTLRGGDRPKSAESEFPDIGVMLRSQYGLFRKRLASTTVADNLQTFAAGGLRRVSDVLPYSDVIESASAGRKEGALAPHPSLKPRRFMLAIVLASMLMGGSLLDPFAGSGSTLAAAAAVGANAIGIERDAQSHAMAVRAVLLLVALAA